MTTLLDRPIWIRFPEPLVFLPAMPTWPKAWWELAACKGQPKPDLFVADGEKTKSAVTRIRPFVNAYCRRCPVLEACYADPAEYGTWAGEIRNGKKNARINLLASCPLPAV